MSDLQEEAIAEYRDIQGYPGYRVGSDGTVWSRRQVGSDRLNRPRPLGEAWRQANLYRANRRGGNRLGYFYVTLRAVPGGKGRHHYVHRLVLEAFVGPCPEGMECCHADGDPSNNRLSNLRWDTRKGNMGDMIRHGPSRRGEKSHLAKLTEEDVRLIRSLIAAGQAQKEVAARFEVHHDHISLIVRRKVWKHVE